MKRNCKVLNERELLTFNNRFAITITETGVMVKANNYDRETFHNFNRGFQLVAQVDDRKLTMKISTEALSIWRNGAIREKFSLVDIQNTINGLKKTQKKVTEQDILDALSKKG